MVFRQPLAGMIPAVRVVRHRIISARDDAFALPAPENAEPLPQPGPRTAATAGRESNHSQSARRRRRRLKTQEMVGVGSNPITGSPSRRCWMLLQLHFAVEGRSLTPACGLQLHS